MAEGSLKVGQRVEVTGKDVQGVIAFVGLTSFAPGKWIGIILDEPKGKNNGSVKGQEYFKCDENYGMFVRSTQIVPIDEHGKPIEGRSSTGREEDAAKARSRLSGVRRKTSPQKNAPSLSASSSRMSLASSRQSLAGSRQSLAGSRSQLASPSVEKSTEVPPDQQQQQQQQQIQPQHVSQIPKRASFIETGFVETLKPQFTPGQVMTSPPNSTEEKLSNLQFQQELDNRDQQIKDLSEKLETLKIKRQEDREKMKEFDKMKIQIEQLLEFKSKIMESQSSLQRELQRAKQEAKDAIEARESHAEEVADLAETVEMATLDKEMAEEKAETLQLELEVCKEKLEEVTLDLELLKAELQDKGGNGEGGVSAFEMKQLEQQNARLRDTLVRMRDLSAHEKHEYQKLVKDLDQKKSEITELGRTKEKLSARVEQMEQQIADLQEQVDAALGAEEMVVILGEQKMTLEDEVKKLKEEVSDLEALQDMNEQLAESNMELEMDLREELDMAHAAVREAIRNKEAALETIADREATINKFRDLVQKLQEQSQDLQRQLEKESSKPVSALPEILDFKKMFTETKAHTKAIDLELRRLDIQQLQQHTKFLSSFMPDTFMSRGGDHDAVLALLLVPRMLSKTDILFGQIREKFPTVNKVDRNGIIKGHNVEQYSFRLRLSHYLCSLQTILQQYNHSMNICTTDALLKVGGIYPEMAAQEKTVDAFVELLKRDQLDENVSTEALEKCITYFNTMYPLLLGNTTQVHHCQLLNDCIRTLHCACDGISTDANSIKALIESADLGDMGLLAQYILNTAEQIQQQLKVVKRRIPLDTNVASLGFNVEIYENLYQCYQHMGKVIKTLQDVVKTTVQAITLSGDTEKGVTAERMKDIAINASDKVYEQDDLGPVQSIKNSLTFILTQISQVSQFLQDNEYDINIAAKNEKKPDPPIVVRALAVKKELEETKTLTNKLEIKESDIKELRKALKMKQEELSEMIIRKELAEKKLGNVNKDYELTIEKLQRKLEEAQNNFKKKEKEFEETLDHLQKDIDSLELEKGEIKEKLKHYSKKAILEGMVVKSSGPMSSQAPMSLGPNLPIVVKDSPLLLQEIDTLKKLFHNERNERIKLQSQTLLKSLSSLEPLPNFYQQRDKKLDELYQEGIALKQEILMSLAKTSIPPVYKEKSAAQRVAAWNKFFRDQNMKMIDLKTRTEAFQAKVAEETIKRKFGAQVQSDFALFPTSEMTKAYKEINPIEIGFVKVPSKMAPSGEKPGQKVLDVTYNELQKLLHTLTASN